MWTNIEELIIQHKQHPIDTLITYKYLEHEDWEEYEDGVLISLVSYFTLEVLSYDMVVAMNRDNVFTMSQWKIIAKILRERTKEIRIQSDPSNKILHKGANKYGGYFIDDYIVFPYIEEV